MTIPSRLKKGQEEGENGEEAEANGDDAKAENGVKAEETAHDRTTKIEEGKTNGQEEGEIKDGEEEEGGNDDDDEEEDDQQSNRAKSTTVIIARTHPGEPNTSFVVQGLAKIRCSLGNDDYDISSFQGILEFLTSDHSIAIDLRKHVEVVVFPMLNPDGVFLGNSRSALFGMDINRSWNTHHTFFTELHSVRKEIRKINEVCKIRAGRKHLKVVL